MASQAPNKKVCTMLTRYQYNITGKEFRSAMWHSHGQRLLALLCRKHRKQIYTSYILVLTTSVRVYMENLSIITTKQGLHFGMILLGFKDNLFN